MTEPDPNQPAPEPAGSAPTAPGPIGPAEGAELTRLAVETVRFRLLNRAPDSAPPPAAALRVSGASFVTLERRGQLRGCIGTLQPARPLYLDVIRNAERAMVDPRLPPVTTRDWPELDVSVSVLTAPGPLPVADRDGLLAALRPGRDGLLITDGRRRATFLPAVWEKLPDPTQFLDRLLAKGGWRPGEWPPDLVVHRYTAIEFENPAPRDPLTAVPREEP